MNALIISEIFDVFFCILRGLKSILTQSIRGQYSTILGNITTGKLSGYMISTPIGITFSISNFQKLIFSIVIRNVHI